MGAPDEDAQQQDPSPSEIGYVEPALPQLAEGTRHDIDARPKGICVATRCQSVEQFVATFHRYCEDSAIFIFNARRAIGTTLPFSFELASEDPVLVGVGTVVEEFTTAQNRFGRAGIVISVQKLKRESIAVFERMIVERQVDRHTPSPALAPAVTEPVAVDEGRKGRRPTLEIRIPTPGERPSTKPRANTLLGLPTIAKPGKPVMQIPMIAPRSDEKASLRVPPRPVDAHDAVPNVVAEAGQDTVRDQIPFAFVNELRMFEERVSLARPVVDVDVDSAWDVEEALMPAARESALPALEPMCDAAPEAVAADQPKAACEAVPEPIAVDGVIEAVASKAPAPALEAGDTITVAQEMLDVVWSDVDAIPIATPAVVADAPTPAVVADAPTPAVVADAPTAPAPHDDGSAVPWWNLPLRFAARIAIVSTLFVASAAITASIDGPAFSPGRQPSSADNPSLPVASELSPSASMDWLSLPVANVANESCAAPTPPSAAPAVAATATPRLAVRPRALAKPAPARKPVRRAPSHCTTLDCL